MDKPSSQHLFVAKRVLRHLRAIASLGLIHVKGGQNLKILLQETVKIERPQKVGVFSWGNSYYLEKDFKCMKGGDGRTSNPTTR